MVVSLFKAATPADRKAVYQRIEGHAWSGDFHRSFGSRDEIYKFLDSKQVDTVKALLDG